VNTSQQVGGSVGTALLNTIAASATAGYLASRARGPLAGHLALVHGYSVATAVAAGILAAAAVFAAVLMNAGRTQAPGPRG